MSREFKVRLFANGRSTTGNHGYYVVETVLYKCVSDGDKQRAPHRTIFQIVWRRHWPFTTCRVKFKLGEVASCGEATVFSLTRRRLGTAMVKAVARAGFEVETKDGPLCPRDVSTEKMASLAKTVGHMFRKNDEFVACRKFCF